MMPIDGWNLASIEDIQAAEFDLGDRQWRIKKLLPGEAKLILIHHVLPMFNDAGDIDSSLPAAAIAFRVISSAKPEHYEALSATFLRHCIQVRNDAGQFVGLATDYEDATKNLLPIELILLDVRAFCVNFGESVSKVVEEFQRMQMEADNQTSPSEPIPSSTPESMQDTIPSQTSKRGRPRANQK